MEYDLYSGKDTVNLEQECRDRMRRFQNRFGQHIKPDLSVAINNSWGRLAASGDWEAVVVWIDKLYELAIKNWETK